MATPSRLKRNIVILLGLLLSHIIAFSVGGIYTFHFMLDANEAAAFANMLGAWMAFEDGDVETAMQHLALAQAKAPDWYGPLVLSAKIYEKKGWPELSLQYLRRAEAAMSANPEAEAGQPWYGRTRTLGQGIDQRMDELEELIARDQK